LPFFDYAASMLPPCRQADFMTPILTFSPPFHFRHFLRHSPSAPAASVYSAFHAYAVADAFAIACTAPLTRHLILMR
jgi:hypothetical protein